MSLAKKWHCWWILSESMCSKKRKVASGFWIFFLWLTSLYAVLQLTDRSFNHLDVHVASNSLGIHEHEVTSDHHCPAQMTIALDMGRLGNKFFEYLAARVMAQVLNSQVYITPSFAEIYDKYFVGRRTPVVDWNVIQYKCRVPQSKFITININYLPNLQPPANYTPYTQVLGYPMNITSATWHAIFLQRDQIVKEFGWKPDLKASAEQKLAQVRKEHNASTVVSVHVRRTDYFIYLVSFYGAFHTANSSYYNNAMDYFRKKYTNSVFLVFSDDINWCKKNIVGPDVLYIGNGNESDPGYDLALMSLSDHVILSYGTYGMMAGYFSNGEVVAADNFTGRPEAMVENLKAVPSLKWKWMAV